MLDARTAPGQPRPRRHLRSACSVVLGRLGLAEGAKRQFSCLQTGLLEQGYCLVMRAVVRDGAVFTSQGPATAMGFTPVECALSCGSDAVSMGTRGLLRRNTPANGYIPSPHKHWRSPHFNAPGARLFPER